MTWSKRDPIGSRRSVGFAFRDAQNQYATHDSHKLAKRYRWTNDIVGGETG
jgi:hypothetical protein